MTIDGRIGRRPAAAAYPLDRHSLDFLIGIHQFVAHRESEVHREVGFFYRAYNFVEIVGFSGREVLAELIGGRHLGVDVVQQALNGILERGCGIAYAGDSACSAGAAAETWDRFGLRSDVGCDVGDEGSRHNLTHGRAE